MPTTVAAPGRPRTRLTFLPPPRDRGDPLAIVALGTAAEVRERGAVTGGLLRGKYGF